MLRPRGNWRKPWRKPWGYPLQDWTPAQIFAGGWQGFYTDPVSGLYLFSDTAGTAPAPLDGAVARLDAPPGSPVAASFTSATASQQPIRRVDGLEFDGVDDRLSYPDDPALRFGTTDFTLAAAVKVDASAGGAIIAKRNQAPAGTDPGWALRQGLFGVIVEYDFPGNTSHTYIFGNILSDGEWADVISYLDRGAAEIAVEVDGVAAPAQSVVLGDIAGTQPLVLGGRPNGGELFDDRIGRTFAINRLLTPAERAKLNAWLKEPHS